MSNSPFLQYLSSGFLCVLNSQDQAFGELEKNSDKILQGTSSSDSSQPAHLHELLCSLQKQLLAYCHINCVTEVHTNLHKNQTTASFLVGLIFICVCQGSSSVALLHKHLQLLLPHATDIYNRSTTLLRESSGNGSVRKKLRGITITDNLTHIFKQMMVSSLMFSVCEYGRCDLHVCCWQYAVSDCDVLAVVAQ